jgi:hypothetical protein
VTFHVTIGAAGGGEPWYASYDEAEAASLLRRAAGHGYTVELTWGGGFNVLREIPGRGCRTIRCEPTRKSGNLTPTVRHDLDLIALRPGASWETSGRIKAGHFSSIPAGASARLRERGLITTEGEAVTVSLQARLARLHQDRRGRSPWSYKPTTDELSVLTGGE